ncbi:MAG TPA: ParB/RepB/Spo0J family partition protein [Candidatus Megaira endosymbiont of Nemacystus decipiens]|nr:ParB/RepB/Spo0J family partition protein [Candidatus Megaera endosymbiont of Nemacystus decipiens]
MMSKKILGRGLSSLLKEEVVPLQKYEDQKTIDIHLIKPNPNQPRKHFDQYKIRELAESINRHGILQPIIVKKKHDSTFEIIAGERRYMAAQIAGLGKVPVVIKKFSEKETLEVALIENIQRQQLNVVEEAQGYEKLIEEFGYSQQQIASSVGKSRSHITNLLRINQLDQRIKDMIIEKKLTMGHARCLVGQKNAIDLAHRVIKDELSVRELEKLLSSTKDKPSTISNTREKNSKLLNSENLPEEDLSPLASSLSNKFGVKVTIENSNNVGKIAFHYNSLEELDTILAKLS